MLQPDDRQEISSMIQRAISASDAKNRFTLTPTNRHQHNGVDAPFAFNPAQVYAGIVVTSSLPSTLPAGWTLSHLGTGRTQVTHNLGDFDQVMWFATPIGAGGATIPVPIVVGDTNVVDFSWFDVSVAGAGAAIDTTFYFMAVQVNNKHNDPPQYRVY